MKGFIIACCVLGLIASSPRALADDAVPAPESDCIAHPFGLFGSVGAALDHGAFNVSLGARYQVFEQLTLGLQVEFNPWYSIGTIDVAPGALNTYASVIFDWLVLDEVALHTTVQVGMSVLLFDLVSAPAGSVGPYVGIGILGATFLPKERLRVIVEAGEVAMPIPNVKGAPFYYRQYRFTVGIEYRL